MKLLVDHFFLFLFVKLHSGMTNSGHCKGCEGC